MHYYIMHLNIILFIIVTHFYGNEINHIVVKSQMTHFVQCIFEKRLTFNQYPNDLFKFINMKLIMKEYFKITFIFFI